MITLKTDSLELPPLTDHEAWDDPILFNAIEAPEIPAAILPEPFSSFAAALANETETSESLSVMTILGVLSAVCSKRFTVNPKDGWAESINIYTLIALPPANNKSLVLKRCTQPLITWEQELCSAMEYEIKYSQSKRKTEEKVIESMRKKAATIKDPTEQREMIEEISQQEAMLTAVPILPQIFANDSTPEALVTSLHEQGGRFALFSDEGGIMETLAGLYNNGHSNIDVLLKGIDGGDLRVRRKDRSINLNPYLTIVLAVQPAIIQSISSKSAYLGNGALERFLYVIPKSKLGYRQHNKPSIPLHLQESYNDKITALLSTTQKLTHPLPLKLTPTALNAWREFQGNVEIELRPNGKLVNCQGWGGKISGFTLRLAGLLHIGQYGIENDTIDFDVMDKAVFLGELLIYHAMAAYGIMGIDQAVQNAKEILQWITTNKINSFTKSDILLAMRSKRWGNAEQINKALHRLIEHNIISEPATLPTKKPTIAYYINPKILETRIHDYQTA